METKTSTWCPSFTIPKQLRTMDMIIYKQNLLCSLHFGGRRRRGWSVKGWVHVLWSSPTILNIFFLDWAFTWLLWTFDYFQDYKASLAPVCFSNVSVGEQGPGVSYSTSFWCHSKWALLLFFFIISSILMYLCSSNSLPSYLRCKAFWNVTDCQWRRDMISTQCDKYHERSLQSMTKLARAPGSKLRTVPLTVFALLVSFLGNVHWETGRFGFHDFPGFIALSGTDNVFSTQKNHVICPGQRTDESWA